MILHIIHYVWSDTGYECMWVTDLESVALKDIKDGCCCVYEESIKLLAHLYTHSYF